MNEQIAGLANFMVMALGAILFGSAARWSVITGVQRILVTQSAERWSEQRSQVDIRRSMVLCGGVFDSVSGAAVFGRIFAGIRSALSLLHADYGRFRLHFPRKRGHNTGNNQRNIQAQERIADGGTGRVPEWVARLWIPVALAIVFGLGVYSRSIVEDLADAYFSGDPLVFSGSPFKTQNNAARPTSTFRAGDPVFINLDLSVTFRGTLHSEILIISLDEDRRRRLMPSQNPIYPGRYQTNARAATLPDDMAPGWYKIVATTSLDGKVRDVSTSWETEPFEIVL